MNQEVKRKKRKMRKKKKKKRKISPLHPNSRFATGSGCYL